MFLSKTLYSYLSLPSQEYKCELGKHQGNLSKSGGEVGWGGVGLGGWEGEVTGKELLIKVLSFFFSLKPLAQSIKLQANLVLK